MNGQSEPSGPAAAPRLLRTAQWSGEAAAARSRLQLALALSCLLHAAVVFLPFLGVPAKETRFAIAGRQKPPPLINATLVSVAEHRHSPANVPPGMQAAPDASAADRPADAAQPLSLPRADGAGLLPLPGTVYYTTDQLTKRPQPVAAAELDAPEIRPIVASGKIVLTLLINEFGAVADVVVEKSDLPEVFSRTAVAAFKAMRFVPGERNGQPVGTLMRIEVNYDDGRVRSF